MASTAMQPSPDRGVIVGKITSVYGIKGWVKVHSFTSPPEGLFNHQPWYLANPLETGDWKTGIRCSVDAFKPHGKGFVAHVQGIDDRDEAARLCQKEIQVERGELPPLPEGDYYWEQLIGLKVVTHPETKPVLLGKVTGLFETGANDVLEVSPCEGSIDKRSRLLPYVPGIHIRDIDLQSGVMAVDWDPEF